MLIFLPTGTDAPLYHPPYATGGLILLNFFVFFAQLAAPEALDQYVLHYGSFNPITWITSIFMHGGWGHVIGNMIYLWTFGLVIEGKVGWWRYILIYLAIGVGGCGFEQVVTFWMSGASLGASGAIFGLIAMAMVWAPENEANILVAGIFFFRPFVFNFQVSLSTLGFCMIGLEFLMASLFGFGMSSAVLHLIGAVPGFAVAYLMIKYRRVNCEGCDMISLWRGERGKVTPTVQEEKAKKIRRAQAKENAKQEMETGLAMVDQHISAGRYEMGRNRFAMLKKRNHNLAMTEQQYVTLIKAFDKDPSTKSKIEPLIQDYLKHYSQYKTPFTLMLARSHILVQDRPRQGLVVLKTLQWKSLNAKQQEFVKQLLQRAKEMIADGVLEVDQ